MVGHAWMYNLDNTKKKLSPMDFVKQNRHIPDKLDIKMILNACGRKSLMGLSGSEGIEFSLK